MSDLWIAGPTALAIGLQRRGFSPREAERLVALKLRDVRGGFREMTDEQKRLRFARELVDYGLHHEGVDDLLEEVVKGGPGALSVDAEQPLLNREETAAEGPVVVRHDTRRRDAAGGRKPSGGNGVGKARLRRTRPRNPHGIESSLGVDAPNLVVGRAGDRHDRAGGPAETPERAGRLRRRHSPLLASFLVLPAALPAR